MDKGLFEWIDIILVERANIRQVSVDKVTHSQTLKCSTDIFS
jgi:hypothetical protein